jgi:hypothetical protein
MAVSVALGMTAGDALSITRPFPHNVAALVPIALNDRIVPGAFGSEWATRFGVANSGSDDLVFLGPIDGPFYSPASPIAALVQPGQSASAGEWFQHFYNPAGNPGVMVFYPPENEQTIHFSLRVQDVSRQAQTWGTEIPVVREHEFRTGRLSLPQVPLDARFRPMLRIYDVDRDGGAVAIRYFDNDGVLLAQESVQFIVPEGSQRPDGLFYYGYWYPGWAQVGDFVARHPQLAGNDRVRIEVEPPAGVHFWAFVSVTNNETQHVTLITPQ